MEPPEDGDESDIEYHTEMHKKDRKGPKPTAQQEKNYKILLEKLRLHFARYLSVNDDEIFDMMEGSYTDGYIVGHELIPNRRFTNPISVTMPIGSLMMVS